MTRSFPHRHLLDIDQLNVADINLILEKAGQYAAQNRTPHKKNDRLAGKTVVNMFFENSTRTRTSFQIAAKRLGADVVNFNAAFSSVNKGETPLDTARVIDSMQVDALVIRHPVDGTPAAIAPHVNACVLNAGDGAASHPTQALLDAMTVLRHKGKITGLEFAICGDIEHSRVARSNIALLKKFGVKARIFTPPQFMPHDLNELGATACKTMKEALQDVDVVMMLRIQNERLSAGEFAMSAEGYHREYGLDHDKLKAAKPDAIIIHPLPLNRGVEITNELADDAKYSLFFKQTELGVAVRMACLDLIVGTG